MILIINSGKTDLFPDDNKNNDFNKNNFQTFGDITMVNCHFKF